MKVLKSVLFLFSVIWFSSANAKSTTVDGVVLNHSQLALAIEQFSDEFSNVSELSIDHRGTVGKIFNWKLWQHVTRPKTSAKFLAVVDDDVIQKITCHLEVDKDEEEIYLDNCSDDEDNRYDDITVEFSQV